MPYSMDMSQFSDTIIGFANYKLNPQNQSKRTVDEYLTDLRTFFRYMIATRDGIATDSDDFDKIDVSEVDVEFLRTITGNDIYRFINYLRNDRGNSAATRSRKLSAIKALYKFLCNRTHQISGNPTADIDSPKKDKKLQKFLSLDESISLLDAVKNDVGSASRTRDYCILTLFLNCGMRVSELAGIKITDLDSSLRSMRVFGKGSKERIIYLNDACRMALGDYLEERLSPQFANVNTKALFLSGKGRNNPLSVKTIQWLVKKYLAAAGLENRGYSVHKLRHTAATLMYQSGGVDVRTLKDILGHEQLNTTQIYTHVSNASMENAMTKNPLADIKPPDVHVLKKIEKEDEE